MAPSIGPTRNEADFEARIARTLASDPTATRWHVVIDNLNTHQAESLVRFVAQHQRLEDDLEAAYGLSGATGTFTAGYMYDLTGHYQAIL